MKTIKILSILVALFATVSCNKELKNAQVEESKVTFNITNGGSGNLAAGTTKVFGPAQGVQSDDNYVNTLEFFIFNAEGDAVGVLDAYKKFTTDDGLVNLEVKATTGAKTIYVVANSHRENWKGVVTLSDFESQLTDLTDENNKNFLMVGNADVELNASSSVTLSISRLVARVCLSSIKTSFENTPYSGLELTNVKVYLTNVHSSKQIYNGLIDAPKLLNNKQLVAEDINSCRLKGLLYDNVQTAIGKTPYNESHYFYTYENLMDAESTESRFTRLVIQADLNGVTYYYPISINQEGYGYDISNGHKGIKRNTSYSINATICRPGSTDPDKPVEHGVISCSVNVLDWVGTEVANPEF